jgi:hypothetical protein
MGNFSSGTVGEDATEKTVHLIEMEDIEPSELMGRSVWCGPMKKTFQGAGLFIHSKHENTRSVHQQVRTYVSTNHSLLKLIRDKRIAIEDANAHFQRIIYMEALANDVSTTNKGCFNLG